MCVTSFYEVLHNLRWEPNTERAVDQTANSGADRIGCVWNYVNRGHYAVMVFSLPSRTAYCSNTGLDYCYFLTLFTHLTRSRATAPQPTQADGDDTKKTTAAKKKTPTTGLQAPACPHGNSLMSPYYKRVWLYLSWTSTTHEYSHDNSTFNFTLAYQAGEHKSIETLHILLFMKLSFLHRFNCRSS